MHKAPLCDHLWSFLPFSKFTIIDPSPIPAKIWQTFTPVAFMNESHSNQLTQWGVKQLKVKSHSRYSHQLLGGAFRQPHLCLFYGTHFHFEAAQKKMNEDPSGLYVTLFRKIKTRTKTKEHFTQGFFFLTQWKTECLLSGTDFGILLVCRVSVKQRTTSPLCATNCEVIGAMDGDRELDVVLSDRIKSFMWSHCVTVQSRKHSPGCMI